jgi:hypothetical protein
MQKAQIKAAIQVIVAVADAIRELGSVPAGHMYAQLSGRMSLDTFNGIIGKLVDAKLVRREPSHLLVWIGPTK